VGFASVEFIPCNLDIYLFNTSGATAVQLQ
jgi:hypothetical protein